MNIAVVGVGGTGSAACLSLAKAGHTVVGYEQFAFGHAWGSSHGASRIIRYTYPDPLYTQLMEDAYPLWNALEAEAEERLLVRCGGLLFGRTGSDFLQKTRASLERVGLPYEELSPRAVSERFPALHLSEGETALFQRESGFLRSSRCVLANLRLARRYGADLREHTTVTAITDERGHPTVHTAEGTSETYQGVLVTSGAWLGKLFASLTLPLSVERRQVVYLDIAHHPEWFAPERFPVWIDADSLYYGFPSDGEIAGVKLASHVNGEQVDPDEDRRIPAQIAIDDAIRVASHRFPALSDRATWTQVCLYTNTPNEDFLIDYVPGLPNVAMVSACSGHGFKFTPLLGEIGAGMVTGKSYPRDLSRFTLKAFRSSSP